MTYIKWKDEVESYLIGLPVEEKKKVFSYFAEMYADKREAGESEEQIIEEFGAPYDVARRILEENKESAPAGSGGGQTVTGGSNYNYNYYNYNYGGAPAQTPPPAANNATNANGTPQPQAPQPQPQPDAFGEGLKMPGSSNVNKKSTGSKVGTVLVLIVLIILIGSFWGSAITVICDGFIEIGSMLGALAASKVSAGEVVTSIGYGLITVGVGFLLLTVAIVLGKCFKKVLKKYKEEK